MIESVIGLILVAVAIGMNVRGYLKILNRKEGEYSVRFEYYLVITISPFILGGIALNGNIALALVLLALYLCFIAGYVKIEIKEDCMNIYERLKKPIIINWSEIEYINVVIERRGRGGESYYLEIEYNSQVKKIDISYLINFLEMLEILEVKSYKYDFEFNHKRR